MNYFIALINLRIDVLLGTSGGVKSGINFHRLLEIINDTSFAMTWYMFIFVLNTR